MSKFQDTDTGSDGNDGSTWALAKLTYEGLLSVLADGEDGWVQGAATDTSASARTFTYGSSKTNPVKIHGVKDGTTNEPPVLSDFAVRGTDTLPKIEVTGAGNDITIATNSFAFISGIHFAASDRLQANNVTAMVSYTKCKISCGGNLYSFGTILLTEYIDCEIESTSSSFQILNKNGAIMNILGGEFTATVVPSSVLFHNQTGNVNANGWDFSSLGNKTLQIPGTSAQLLGKIKLVNCKAPVTFTIWGGSSTHPSVSIELIACNDTTSQAVGSSIQDYIYEDIYGTIDAEFTAVRTGGADDGASGGFSYAMTPRASATLESSQATLKSPWMRVWVEGGSNTLTVYIANDSASTDYNEDELWCEFYTPDSGDTAQHEQNFDPADARLFASSTAVTDDTGSTWGTGANNHQKMSVSVTTGFEGVAYARIHLAKRGATPDTLFLDPVIEVI